MTGIILAVFLGWAGAYRFYKRQFGMGILYLFTVGLFCMGWIVDIIDAVKNKDVDFSKVEEYKKDFKSSSKSDDYWYFDDKYYEECQKWDERIDNIDVCSDNADKNVAAYKKKIELANEFKSFCESKRGGSEYWNKEYSNYISNIEEELSNYMKDGYQIDKEYEF